MDSMATPKQYGTFNTPQNDEFYSGFSYPELNAQRDEIRLLKVDTTGSGRHKLVSNVPLGRAPSYSAISYFAGDQNDTKPLSVNNRRFNAFANLDRAIRHIISFWNREQPGVPLVLWTDQICINQSDPQERARQVAFMREIYRRADQVFVSMPVDGKVKDCIRWLQSVKPHDQQPYASSEPMMAVPVLDNYAPQDPHASFTNPAPTWGVACDIINHPWWQRAWVYQEFMLATRAYFIFSDNDCIQWDTLEPLLRRFFSFDLDMHRRNCESKLQRAEKWTAFSENHRRIHNICTSNDSDDGDYYLGKPGESCCENGCKGSCGGCSGGCCSGCCDFWCDRLNLCARTVRNAFVGAIYLLSYLLLCFCWWPKMPQDAQDTRKHMSRLDQVKTTARARVLFIMESKRLWSGSMPLSQLMKHARNCHTSQPKDKVYAFMGLAPPDHGIVANYTAGYSVNDTLTDAARSVVQTENSLSLLLDAGAGSGDRPLATSDDILPSWVPNWAVVRRESHVEILRGIGLPNSSIASQGSRYLTSYSFDEGGKILKIQGVLAMTLGNVALETYKPWRSFHGTLPSLELTVTTVSRAQPGDEVWVLPGESCAFILRQESGSQNTRVLLGPAMIWDEMDKPWPAMDTLIDSRGPEALQWVEIV